MANDLKKNLISLGYSARVCTEITDEMIAENTKKPHEYFIIMFYHTLQKFPSKNKYIIYQLGLPYNTEDSIQDEEKYYTKMIEIFDNSVEWWEYSPTNLSLYPSQWKNKIVHIPLPIAIHDTPWRCIDYKYDLLFCGGVNARRLKICFGRKI